jgi:hypothetical protein
VPSYYFICKLHKAFVEVTRISPRPWTKLSADERKLLATCPQQNGLGREIHQMERAPRGPTAQVKETLDNGAMKRKVERFKDAEKLYKDRSKQNP